MDTREKIMDTALHMFSERGYEAVSIRDICGAVGIKESTLYYHFKNKQDILDSLIEKFEIYIKELLKHLNEIVPADEEKNNSKKKCSLKDNNSEQVMDSYMIDGYLFDPFCNLMLRLMMIEQFHDEKIRKLYEKTLFTDPKKIHRKAFEKLNSAGLIPEDKVEWITESYYSYMTMLTFKYLLNGELTDKKKKAYRKEVQEYMNKSFARFFG